jgi:hypothetical protein
MTRNTGIKADGMSIWPSAKLSVKRFKNIDLSDIHVIKSVTAQGAN